MRYTSETFPLGLDPWGTNSTSEASFSTATANNGFVPRLLLAIKKFGLHRAAQTIGPKL
eukprot:m.485340 g.485340  ORF g.485340 m.485340 type:complete len:59 (-) comp74327_c0_seq1:221-397(-)